MPKKKATATTKPPAASVSTGKSAKSAGEYKSPSPLADFYEMWNALGEKDVSNPKGLFEVVQALAEASRKKYLLAPIPMPGHAEQKFRELLLYEVTGKEDDELEMRRKTLRQFKYYLRNQAKHRQRTHDEAFRNWQAALEKYEGEVAWACKGRMSKTTYRKDTVDAIFGFITKACDCLWAKHRLKESCCPQPLSEAEQIKDKVERLSRQKRFQGREDIIEAFRATLQHDPIAYSDYAKQIGAKCNQNNGTLTIAGLKPLKISKGSDMAWLVIRLLLESKEEDGITKLYSGWDGTFSESSKDDKNTIRRKLIVTVSDCRSKNNKLYRLISAEEYNNR